MAEDLPGTIAQDGVQGTGSDLVYQSKPLMQKEYLNA